MSHRRLFVAVVSIAAVAACMKKPNFNDNDGDPVSADAVQESVLTGWGDVDLLTMNQDEFSLIQKDLAVGDMAPRVRQQDGKTVNAVTDGEDHVRSFTILQQVDMVQDDNSSKTTSDQRVIRIARDSAAVEAIKADAKILMMGTATQKAKLLDDAKALPLSFETALGLTQVCRKGDNWDVTCFNLRSWEATEAAPELLTHRDDCEGLVNCQIRKRYVAFSMVLKSVDANTSTETRTKMNYTLGFSDDVPLLSRLTDFCYQGIGSVQDLKFPLVVCQRVRDFRRGTPVP